MIPEQLLKALKGLTREELIVVAQFFTNDKEVITTIKALLEANAKESSLWNE